MQMEKNIVAVLGNHPANLKQAIPPKKSFGGIALLVKDVYS